MKNIRGKGPCATMVVTAVLFTTFLAFAGCEQPGGTVSPAAPDSDATLRELTLSAGSLSPAFDPARTVYSAEVGNGVKAVTVTGAANSRYAVVGGQNGQKRNLDVGLNPPVAITVTAQDGTEKTYTVTLTRLEKRLIAIRSTGDLAKIGVDPGFSLAGEYRLETDLTLEHWVPIGGVFSGQFDGNNHTITIKNFAEGVFLDKKTCLGVFGSIRGSADSKALVKDLTVRTEISETISRTGVYYVGALTGYAGAYTELDNIGVTGSLRFENTATGRGAGIYSGGVAGGSGYSFKTYYSGKIEDCSSTGDISGQCTGGYWVFAGGIAGTIVGDGSANPEAPAVDNPTGPTRVVRSYATGTITARDAGWPYAGGIVGYNYYGALVSQCYFLGDVIATGEGYDYSGGIAGYNSKQYGGHSSRIEDCWSSGTVQGGVNAGGIVGQNQVAAITERCYSRSALSARAVQGATGSSSQQGAGGIAGYNAVSDGRATGTVRNCVALNPSIEAPNGFDLVYRVIGNGGGTIADNRAYSGMALTVSGAPWSGGDPGPNAKDGAECTAKPCIELYRDTLGWDFTTVWKMGDDGYPILRWTGIVGE